MKENGNWYDHLKPSNNAELGCYMMIILLLCWAPVIYLDAVYPSEMAGVVLGLSLAYWWAYAVAYSRHKRLEDISLPAHKLHLVAFLLVLSGVAGLLLILGIRYLIDPLEIFVISLVWGLVSVVVFMLILIRLDRLTDFFLRYVSKE